jgi:hypothetical protein
MTNKTTLLVGLMALALLNVVPMGSAVIEKCPDPEPHDDALVSFCLQVEQRPYEAYTVQRTGSIPGPCVTANICGPDIPLYFIQNFEATTTYYLNTKDTHVTPSIEYARDYLCLVLDEVPFISCVSLEPDRAYFADADADGVMDLIGFEVDGSIFYQTIQ